MPFDAAVRRIALYTGAALGVIALTSVTVKTAQRDVRDSIDDLRTDVQQVREAVRTRAVVDSIRSERILDIVTLAVTALVEPAGSVEKSAAVAELRKLRRITP